MSEKDRTCTSLTSGCCKGAGSITDVTSVRDFYPYLVRCEAKVSSRSALTRTRTHLLPRRHLQRKNCPRLLQLRANNLGVCTEPLGRPSALRVRAQGCRRPLHFQHSRSTSCSFALSSSSLDFSASDSVFRWARVSFSCTSCVAISGSWGDFIYFLYAGGGRRRKGLKAELTADAAVMTSQGEDAPPVYGRGEEKGGGLLLLPPLHGLPLQVGPQHSPGVCVKRRREESRCGTSGGGVQMLLPATDVAVAGVGMRLIICVYVLTAALSKDAT